MKPFLLPISLSMLLSNFEATHVQVAFTFIVNMLNFSAAIDSHFTELAVNEAVFAGTWISLALPFYPPENSANNSHCH